MNFNSPFEFIFSMICDLALENTISTSDGDWLKKAIQKDNSAARYYSCLGIIANKRNISYLSIDKPWINKMFLCRFNFPVPSEAPWHPVSQTNLTINSEDISTKSED